MPRPVLLLILNLACATSASCAFTAAPETHCVALDANPCRTATVVIVDQLGPTHPIQRIGLFGYHGCLGYCPLMLDPAPAPLEALAAVRFGDGSEDQAVTITGFDRGALKIIPTEGLSSEQVFAMAEFPK